MDSNRGNAQISFEEINRSNRHDPRMGFVNSIDEPESDKERCAGSPIRTDTYSRRADLCESPVLPSRLQSRGHALSTLFCLAVLVAPSVGVVIGQQARKVQGDAELQQQNHSTNPQLADYAKLRKLGEGSFGEVWIYTRREDKNEWLPESIAVKSVKEGAKIHDVWDITRDKHTTLWESEVFYWKKASESGSGVVQLYGHDEENMWMPVVKGCKLNGEQKYNLKDLGMDGRNTTTFQVPGELAQRPKEQLLLEVAIDLVSVLFRIHANGVAHMDLKPDNILIDCSQGKLDVLLADFGMAAAADEEVNRVFKRIGPENKVSTHGWRGSKKYAAPEVQTWHTDYPDNPLEYTRKYADMYSMALVLQELFDGKKPYGIDQVLQVSDPITREEKLKDVLKTLKTKADCNAKFDLLKNKINPSKIIEDWNDLLEKHHGTNTRIPALQSYLEEKGAGTLQVYVEWWNHWYALMTTLAEETCIEVTKTKFPTLKDSVIQHACKNGDQVDAEKLLQTLSKFNSLWEKRQGSKASITLSNGRKILLFRDSNGFNYEVKSYKLDQGLNYEEHPVNASQKELEEAIGVLEAEKQKAIEEAKEQAKSKKPKGIRGSKNQKADSGDCCACTIF